MSKHFLNGFLAMFIIILLGSCNNDITNIGLGMNGQLVGTNFTDTVTVSAYSFLEDTISTQNLSANLVGNIHDPVFGDTKATIYSQFTLSGSSVNFGEQPIIDSVVLNLQISSYYGDTNSLVGIRVYELTEALVKNGHYKQNSSVTHNSTALNYSQTGYNIHPTSEVIVDTSSYSPHLRIRLSNDFGQYLLNNQTQMHNTTIFSNFFKGLCITAESHSGSTGYMLLTNMNSSLSGIVLYYHNNGKSSKKYTFPCKSDCVRFNQYEHNYTNNNSPTFSQEVLQGDHSVGAQQLFIQATGGVKTRIQFPHLAKTFTALNNRVVINRAELVITDVSPDELYLVHPAALSLQGIKKDGSIAYLPDDDYYTSASYYGGTYDASKHEYRFRITNYVQGLINDNSELTESLNLVVKGSGVRANRLIFGGTGLNDSKRLRLELSYTTY